LYQVDPKERVDICFWGERDSRYIGFINSDGIFTENQRVSYPTNQPTNQPTKQPTNGNQYFQIETQIFDTFPKQPGHFPPPKKKITASGEPASQRMVRGLRRSLCGVNSLYQSLGCIFLVEVFRDQMVEMVRVDFILLGLRINHEG